MCPESLSLRLPPPDCHGADKIVVRTSLLKGTKDFKVDAEIYGRDRLSWQTHSWILHHLENKDPRR